MLNVLIYLAVWVLSKDINDLEQVNNPGMIDPEFRFIFQIMNE